MAYQTGTFTSLTDLESTIKAFAQSNGWTLAGSVLHNGSAYFKLTSDTDYLNVQAGLGIDGGNELTTACSKTQRVFRGLDGGMTFPGTYHLFAHASPDTIFCVVNYNVLYCQQLCFGEIRKFGTWGGGQYCTATGGGAVSAGRMMIRSNFGYTYGEFISATGAKYHPQGYLLSHRDSYAENGSALYCDLDGANWRDPCWDYPVLSGAFAASDFAKPYLYVVNPVTLQPVLSPCLILAKRPDTKSSVIGDMPHLRYLRIDNYEIGDIIQIGSQPWMVFPHAYTAHSKGGIAIKYDGP